MKTKSITKATLLSILVMSVITAVTLNSCQKESIKPKVTDTKSKGTVSLAASSASLISDINNIVFSIRKGQKGLVPGGGDSTSCVVVTTDTIDKPVTLTYNYGSGCVGSDGKIRTGVIVFSYLSDDIKQVNNVFSATMQNYTVNNTVYNGTQSITNIGYNGANNLVLAESGRFTSMAPQQIQPDTFNVGYYYEWISGESSSPLANLQFSVTGGWTSSYVAGQTDSLVITAPLIKNAKFSGGCNYYIQGTYYTATKTPLGEQYAYTDYSTPGGCTGQYSVTQNGATTVQNQ